MDMPVTALEKGHQGALLGFCPLKNVCWLVQIGVNHDGMFPWEVDLEPHHVGLFLMHGAARQSHECLHCRDIVGIEIHLDFIDGLALSCELHGGAIVSLVYILVYLLH